MTRPLHLTALLVLLLALPVAARADTASSPNLLANPGFEDALANHPWMPATWDTLDAGLSTVFFGRDTFLVHGGRYAVSVANLSMLYPMWHNWSQTLVVGKELWGKDVELSVWTRSAGLQGRGYVLLQAYRDTIEKMSRIWKVTREAAAQRLGYSPTDNPHVVLGWQRKYFSEPETEWIQRTARIFIPPSTDVVIVRCGIFGTGQVMFDDASLIALPALPPPPVPLHVNLLADSSFEGDGNDWEYSMPPYENQVVEKDSTFAHTGKYCIRMHGGAKSGWVNTRAGVLQLIANRSLSGKRLLLSAWVKTDSLSRNAYLKIFCSTPDGDVHNVPEGFAGTNDWTHTVLVMDAPPETYLTWAWGLYTVPAAGTVYFDDMSLEVIGPAEYLKTGAPPPKPPPLPAR